MKNRNKYLPFYVFFAGLLCLSFGYNIVLNEEIRVLEKEKSAYKTFNDYLYLKYLELQLQILDGKFNQNLT
jgi:hypothetical protein